MKGQSQTQKEHVEQERTKQKRRLGRRPRPEKEENGKIALQTSREGISRTKRQEFIIRSQ